MRLRLLAKAVASGAAAMLLGVLAPAAAEANVACGQTITASLTLTHDLTCPGNGIFVNASNVTLDLNGHTITGPAPTENFNRGVDIRPGRTGVTVLNGTIRGFDRGVNISSGANNATLRGLTLDANVGGIGSPPDTSGATIQSNTITNTTQFSGMQIGGNNHVIEANTITNGASSGIFLSGSNNLISGNRITDMGARGISIDTFPSNPGPFTGNRVIGNVVSGSGRLFNASSIAVRNGQGTLFEGNTVTGRRQTPGIFVENSAATLVYANHLENNNPGVLVRGSSAQTRLLANRATDNTNGITVESAPTGTLVDANTTWANQFNGISVQTQSATITRNTSHSNGNWGIVAVNGVAGSGNTAYGNGQPTQCSPAYLCS